MQILDHSLLSSVTSKAFHIASLNDEFIYYVDSQIDNIILLDLSAYRIQSPKVEAPLLPHQTRNREGKMFLCTEQRCRGTGRSSVGKILFQCTI